MKKKAIRNIHSSRQIPPRLFDVIVEGENVDVEFKIGKNEYERIPWIEVVSLVEQASKSA